MTLQPVRLQLDAFRVAGLTARTSNGAEQDHATSCIGALWDRFFGEEVYESTPHRTTDKRLFGVYSAYASDAHGAYDVTTGVAVFCGERSVAIEAGQYLVFNGRGDMPQMVISTWQQIWAFFASHPDIARRYRSDFEAYEGPNHVAIHIGVS